MGQHYSHLDAQKRIFLSMMLQKNYSKAKIASILGVSRSTIYREIKRNGCSPIRGKHNIVFYLAGQTQRKYEKRRQGLLKLHQDASLQKYVHEKLSKGWSPWQIEGRLKYESDGVCQISHETIYRYIYSDISRKNEFYKRLRRKHPFRQKHHSRKSRVPESHLIKHRSVHILFLKNFLYFIFNKNNLFLWLPFRGTNMTDFSVYVRQSVLLSLCCDYLVFGRLSPLT